MPQPSPLTPARQRAQVLASSGDLAGARTVLERAVDLGRVNLSEDDPDVLVTAHQLARVHQQADDPAAARRVLEEAYAAGQWRLGDGDPLMVAISHDIGVVAEELGNRHEARKAFLRVAEFGPAALGDDHEAVARARAYLGHDPDSVRRDPSSPATYPVPGSPTDPPATACGPVPPEDSFSSAQPGATFKPTAGSNPPPPRAQPTAGFTSAPTPRAAEPGPAQPWPPAPPAGYPVAMQGYPGASPTGVGLSGGVDAYRKRGVGLFAAIAAVLAAVIAVVALVFVLADRAGQPRGPENVPTLAGPTPGDVRLRDMGTVIELSWTDPSGGTVSFMVAMGRAGQQLKPIGTLGPGQTSYRAGGLNEGLDYCFAVIAVYRSDRFATSPQLCTRRAPAGTRPSTSK